MFSTGGRTLATNPPKGDRHRQGEPKTEQWVKRDTDTGRFIDVKQDGEKFKDVRRENPSKR